MPGLVGIWDGSWVSFGVSSITAEDVRVWPYSVSLLVKVSAFLGILHWPAGAVEFGVGGVSFVELLILYEQWAGERLCLEAAVPEYRRVGRPISVSAVPFGPGIAIWRSCRFLGAIFVPFLCCLVVLGGLFLGVLGLIMADFGTLVGISVVMVLNLGHVRLLLFGFWMSFSFSLGTLLPLSGADLLAGVLPLRYSSDNFAHKVPTWRLLVDGSLVSFLASGELVRDGPSALSAALGGVCVRLASDSGGGVKRVRLYRKTPAHFARQGVSGVQFRPRVWKRLRDSLGSDSSFPGAKFLRVHQEAGGHDPGFARAGIG